MSEEVKIIQIMSDSQSPIYGLGEDSKVYIWQPRTATWLLNKMGKEEDE